MELKPESHVAGGVAQRVGAEKGEAHRPDESQGGGEEAQ